MVYNVKEGLSVYKASDQYFHVLFAVIWNKLILRLFIGRIAFWRILNKSLSGNNKLSTLITTSNEVTDFMTQVTDSMSTMTYLCLLVSWIWIKF